MKKVLFTANIDEHITHFHMNYIRWFQNKGYDVHVASNGSDHIEGVEKKFNVPFSRKPLTQDSWEAYKVLRKIVREHEYEVVHCHTPMGAFLTRLATRSLRKEGVKVLYTAHGFHFFKGSPTLNWAIYYPIEKLLARYTDCLITINPEDFNTANEKKFKTKDIQFVHGVGVNTNKFHPVSDQMKQDYRRAKGLKKDAFILTMVGELTYRKNQGMMIEAVKGLTKDIPNFQLLIVGEGEVEKDYKQKVAELGLEEVVQFLGFRKDIAQLMQLSDVSVTCSRQEGLPVNVMEAMATGLPVVATNCRGNRDLVRSEENGFKVELGDTESLEEAIRLLYQDEKLRDHFGKRSRDLIQNYSSPLVYKEMDAIYSYYIKQKTAQVEVDVN